MLKKENRNGTPSIFLRCSNYTLHLTNAIASTHGYPIFMAPKRPFVHWARKSMGDIKLIGEDMFGRKSSKDRAHDEPRTPQTAQPTTTRLFGSSDSEYLSESDGRASPDESGDGPGRAGPSMQNSGVDSNGNGGETTGSPFPIFGTAVKRIDPCHKAFEIQKWYVAQLSMAENSELSPALEQAVWHWLKDHDADNKYETAAHKPCVVCHVTTLNAADSILDQDLGLSSSLNLQYNDSERYMWSFGA